GETRCAVTQKAWRDSMKKTLYLSLLLILPAALAAQTNKTRTWNATTMVFEARPATLRLAPHVTTTIRLPEPINSVILGDSNLFQAEYSAEEPLLVFAKPITPNIAQTNLVISTTRGRQFVLLLRSIGASADEGEFGVDLLVTCQTAGVRFIEDTFAAALISETLNLRPALPLVRPDGSDLTSEIESGLAL